MRYLIAAIVLSASTGALAAEYQLLIHEHPEELAKREDRGAAGQAYWKAYADMGQRLQQAGVLRGGAALRPERLNASAGVPAAVTNAQLSGWFVIEVASADEASRWAAQIPAAQSGGRVEVRALYPVPGMSAPR